MTDVQLLIRPVAPEDLRVGDHVVITHRVDDYLPATLDVTLLGGEMTPLRVRTMPQCAGWPYEIVSICLPFAMVADAVNGAVYNLDLRRETLARVPETYAEAAYAFQQAQRAEANAP